VTALLRAATGGAIEKFETQSYENLMEERRRQKGSVVSLKMVRWNEKSRAMIVIPAEDAMSAEVQEWCLQMLSKRPKVVGRKDGVEFKFTNIADAVYFRIRWC
jgi:hypothetical protein